MGGSGGASGSSGVPSNASGAPAVAYQPQAQPAADVTFQNLLGGFAGSLGPQFQSAFGTQFPNVTTDMANAFAGTPGGQAYGMAQPFFGPGTISDPNNPLYQLAQNAAQGAYGAFQPAVANYSQNFSPLTSPLTNPFIDQAIQAAQTASPLLQASGMQGLTGGQALGGIGADIASQISPSLASALGITGQIPGYAGSLLGAAGPAFNTALGTANQAAGGGGLLSGLASSELTNFFPGAFNQGLSNATLAGYQSPTLTRAGESILNTAFDPQQALFNQLSNQVQQQQNAINAQTGVGGSPYGANLTGQQLSNFDINWQNQQLARQQAGLGAASGAFQNAAQLAQAPLGYMQTGLGTLGAAAPIFSAANQLGQAPLGAINQAGGTLGTIGGLGNAPLSSLTGATQAGQGAGNVMNQGLMIGGTGAGQLVQGGGLPSAAAFGQAGQANTLQGNIAQQLQQMSAMGGQPYNTQQAATSNALSGLSGLTNLGNQQFAIPQQLANDLQSYLMLGQAASGLSGQLGNLGQQQLANSMSGIGSALGTGSNLLFGNSLGQGGGLLGAAGLNPFTGAAGAGGAQLAASGALVPGITQGAFATAPFTDLAASAAPAATSGFSAASLLPFGLGS